MTKDYLAKRLAVGSILAAVIALGLTSSGAGAAQTSVRIPNCVAANNLEAIVDDSGSMAGEDPSRYRKDLVEIIAAFNFGKTMGAIEFGTQANGLFGPLVLSNAALGPPPTAGGVNRAPFGTIRGNLNFLIDADNGGTDYDEAFAFANIHNPNAQARIFLSDGQPNQDPDPANYTNPNIRTHTVGFGQADLAELQKIATATGGPPPLSVTDAAGLQTVGMILNARLSCERDPKLFTDRFVRGGQAKGHAFKPSGKSSQLLLSWPNVSDVLNLVKFRQGKGGGKSSSLASLAGKRRAKVRIKRTRGATYVAVKLKKLRKGKKVKFKVKSKRIGSPTTVTTAVIR